MVNRSRGFALLDLLIAVVLLLIGTTAVTQLFLGATEAVSQGRRWTAMAVATSREVARLERGYRTLAPGCLVPPAGTSLSTDGVGLRWTAAGDSIAAIVTIEVRAASARRVLVDTVVAGFFCR
jgi:Tfp pilus assembly protein PilE